MEYYGVKGSSPDSEDGKILFDLASKEGRWSDAINKCRENPFLLAAAITGTNDTLLHLAVSEGQEKTVREITNIISEQLMFCSDDIVGHRNDRGNTALHLAAVVGNVAMCKCIAEFEPSLIVEGNKEKETALSLAVLFGKKEAFLCLTQMLMQYDPFLFRESQEMKYGPHDNTILHYAISEDQYDLAWRFIKLYDNGQYNVANKERKTPLHLLAGKPSAFLSGSLLVHGLCKTIIYHCTLVDENDVKIQKFGDLNPIERKQANYPENCRTCVDFFLLFRDLVRFVLQVATRLCKVREQRHEEGSERQHVNPEVRACIGAWKHRFSQAIKSVLYKIFKAANKTMVIVLIALGREEVLETPLLIAARNGISEIVEKILELYPIAIHGVNEENKNVMLLAVQNRQPQVFEILLKKNIMIKDRVLRVVDVSGNTAAHLAAELGDQYRPWQIPGEALQMQYEIKWFEYVTKSTPPNFLTRQNEHGKTPEELFIEKHSDLVQKGGEWLIKTSESYSVVAGLIATVAFATSTAVPGGVRDNIGTPTLENRPPFHLFAMSSLIALCFSVTALVTFLSILTSRYKVTDFGKDLPMKLLIGLTSLFFAIAAMLVSFCSGHLFVIDDKLRYVAYPVYAATCIPVTLFAVMQFPLYFDLIQSTFRKVPRRSYKPSVLIK